MSGSHLCTPRNETVISKTELQYYLLSPSSYTHISVRDLYNSRIGLSILLQENMWTDPGNMKISQRHMNMKSGTEAAQFLEKEYINRIFIAVWWPAYCHMCNVYIAATRRFESDIIL